MKFTKQLILTISFLMVTNYALAHAGSLNKVAVKACTAKQKSQTCEYVGDHNDLYIGSCQYMADNLLCVRNQPIQQIKQTTSSSNVQHTHKDTDNKKQSQ